MKSILFVGITSLFLLTSCGTDKPGIIEDSGEIIADYADTLETSIGDARAVAEKMNQQQAERQKALEESR